MSSQGDGATSLLISMPNQRDCVYRLRLHTYVDCLFVLNLVIYTMSYYLPLLLM